jgi:hypothetical protein
MFFSKTVLTMSHTGRRETVELRWNEKQKYVEQRLMQKNSGMRRHATAYAAAVISFDGILSN